MLCNPVSYYPIKIDEMTFFQDNDLEKVEIINTYGSLVAQGRYSEAIDYINQQKGIYGFFADFFNLIENRIYNLQQFLLQKPPKEQLLLYYNEKVILSIHTLSLFSDIDEQENIDSLKLFSDIDNLEQLESTYIFTNDNEEEIEPFIYYVEEEKEPSLVTNRTIWI